MPEITPYLGQFIVGVYGTTNDWVRTIQEWVLTLKDLDHALKTPTLPDIRLCHGEKGCHQDIFCWRYLLPLFDLLNQVIGSLKGLPIPLRSRLHPG